MKAFARKFVRCHKSEALFDGGLVGEISSRRAFQGIHGQCTPIVNPER